MDDEGAKDDIETLTARMATLSSWAGRLERRVVALEAEIQALRDRVKVHESRAVREMVRVNPRDPRADLDEVPTKKLRRPSTAALEAAKAAADMAEEVLRKP